MYKENVHEGLGIQEYRDFFDRAVRIRQSDSSLTPGAVLQKACYNGGSKINEVIVDVPSMSSVNPSEFFSDFEEFMRCVNIGSIEIRRFKGSNLTENGSRFGYSSGGRWTRR